MASRRQTPTIDIQGPTDDSTASRPSHPGALTTGSMGNTSETGARDTHPGSWQHRKRTPAGAGAASVGAAFALSSTVVSSSITPAAAPNATNSDNCAPYCYSRNARNFGRLIAARIRC